MESDEVDLTVLETLDEDLADAIDFENGKVISINFDDEIQPWKRHTSKSTDGEDSARAYSTSRDWFSEQVFAVRIEGPGYITFKWRLETGRMPDELEEFVLACTLDEEFFSSEENNMLAMHTDAKSSSQAKWIDNWAAIPEGMSTDFTFMKDSEQMGRAYVDQLVFEPAKEGSRNRSPCLPRRQNQPWRKVRSGCGQGRWIPDPDVSMETGWKVNPGCHKSGLSS